ncbi:hypothetical protein D9M69_622890 [compost metagenome]
MKGPAKASTSSGKSCTWGSTRNRYRLASTTLKLVQMKKRLICTAGSSRVAKKQQATAVMTTALAPSVHCSQIHSWLATKMPRMMYAAV